MIKVDKLQKSFGDVKALVNASFHLEAGEIVALLGGNGHGKSTAINIITGILPTDAGSVSIDDIDPFVDPVSARKKIGVFPDKPGLFPNLTAREHLRFVAAAHGFKGNERDQLVDEAIALLDMQEIADRVTKGFSQGQTVKVALGRAIVHRPKYLILDEPSRGLDVFALRSLRALLLRLKEAGTGILFSSHVMQEVDLLADRLAVISRGTVCAEGTPSDLKAQTGQALLEDAFMALVQKEAENV